MNVKGYFNVVGIRYGEASTLAEKTDAVANLLEKVGNRMGVAGYAMGNVVPIVTPAPHGGTDIVLIVLSKNERPLGDAPDNSVPN